MEPEMFVQTYNILMEWRKTAMSQFQCTHMPRINFQQNFCPLTMYNTSKKNLQKQYAYKWILNKPYMKGILKNIYIMNFYSCTRTCTIVHMYAVCTHAKGFYI